MPEGPCPEIFLKMEKIAAGSYFFKVSPDGKAAYMLTLQELEEITEIPDQKTQIPTAKRLKETGRIVVEKHLENGTWITAYQNGYALYHICGHDTVFPIHTCRDYLYASGGVSSYIPGQFFEKEPWYVRLVLEGEDRLERNLEVKEQRHTVSYSAVSEEWGVLECAGISPLEHLVGRENREEMLLCLTKRQQMAVCLCYFQHRTQKEAAEELGISGPAVAAILSQAGRRLRKKYPSRN